MQIPAIRTAKENEWRCIVADRDQDAPGALLADRFEKIDLKDYEEIYQRAREIKDGEGLDGIFTAGTDFSYSVAYTAEKLGLPGIPAQTALGASNKSVMRELFRRNGIPSPRFTTADSDEDAEPDIRFPVVVKPVDNMGARGVKMAENNSELSETLPKAISFSRSGKAIIEEFIKGNEYSLDAVIDRGEITVTGFADRHISFRPYFVEMGHTIPTAAPLPVRKAVIDVFKRGIKALGINHGAAKGDIFYGPEGAVIGEIAARLSGGYMSGWTFPLSSGINLTEAAMRLALGMKPSGLKPIRNWISAERAFISIPGKVSGIRGIEAAHAVEGVEEVFIRVKQGDIVSLPINNVEKCGNIISALPERTKAVDAAEKAAALIIIILEKNNEETRRFLFSEPGPPFTAFNLETKESKAFLNDMTRLSRTMKLLKKHQIRIPYPAGFNPETLLDWNHRSAAETISRYQEITRRQIIFSPSAPSSEGAFFWKILLRGGIQGLIYCS